MWPTLQIGSRGQAVANWQRFLIVQGANSAPGSEVNPLTEDSIFGALTLDATRRWQEAEGLPVTGVVGNKDRVLATQALRKPYIPFLQAQHYTAVGTSARPVSLIVIHTMENAEKPDSAENVALWFAGLVPEYPAPRASAHFCVDPDSIVQCVRVEDCAWHAEGSNRNGIGIEHAGLAAQDLEQWHDVPSLLILDRSAQLAAELAVRFDIPIAKLAPDEIKAGCRGFCGHVDSNIAHGISGHRDPGQNFPYEEYLNRVADYARDLVGG